MKANSGLFRVLGGSLLAALLSVGLVVGGGMLVGAGRAAGEQAAAANAGIGTAIDPDAIPAALIPIYDKAAASANCSVVTPVMLAAQDKVESNFDGYGDSSSAAGIGNLTLATWNTLKTNSVHNTVAGMVRLSASADVIGGQELGSVVRRVSVARASSPAFAMYGNNAVPIFWRVSKLQLVGSGTVQVFGVHRVERGAGNSSTLGPKHINWVRLRVRATGVVFTFFNNHIVPTISVGYRFDPHRPKRVALYRQQMARLLPLVDAARAIGPVAVSEDGNFDAKAEAQAGAKRERLGPYSWFGAHGMVSNWRVAGFPGGGTRHGAYIDYLWLSAGFAASVFQQAIGPKSHSDHSPVVVFIRGRAVPLATAKSGKVGIAQFTPQLWAVYGVDGDGDGRKDARNFADAIPAQARYDCALARQLRGVPGDPVANVLAAYHVGAYAVIHAGGVPSSATAYVATVKGWLGRYAQAATSDVALPSGVLGKMISLALSRQGGPYVFGAAGPRAFDCSGLVMWALKTAGGPTLPHNAGDMYRSLQHITAAEARPGDLVFFNPGEFVPGEPGHVGILLGNGRFVGAQSHHPGNVARDIRTAQVNGFGTIGPKGWVRYARITLA